jgi:hypothetical protein
MSWQTREASRSVDEAEDAYVNAVYCGSLDELHDAHVNLREAEREECRAAATERYWQDKQGDEYGSY